MKLRIDDEKGFKEWNRMELYKTFLCDEIEGGVLSNRF